MKYKNKWFFDGRIKTGSMAQWWAPLEAGITQFLDSAVNQSTEFKDLLGQQN